MTFANTSNANEVLVDQSGGNFVLSITQIGEDNSAGVYIYGDNNNITQYQEGNFNGIGGTGVALGSNNTLTFIQTGQYNQFEGRMSGDNNVGEFFQGGTGESGHIGITLDGDGNNVRVYQGKRQDGGMDAVEGGDHEAFWTVTGSNNVVGSYQTDNAENCCVSAHHTANIVVGDLNNVVVRQQSNGAHMGFVEVQGNNNNVDLTQTGNGSKFTDIVLTGDGHSTTNFQGGGGAHSLELNLYNGGGAYNVNTNQTSSINQSYTLTGACTNPAGCGITITQQ